MTTDKTVQRLEGTAQSRLIERAHSVIAGGTLALLELPRRMQRVVDRGRGSRVWDLDGNEYIDYMMGSGPLILGHDAPAVRDAAINQIGRGTQFYALTEASVALAARMVDAIPCAEQVRFVTTGNEATFMALRLARAHTGRSLIIRFEGGYHGTHDYAMFGYRYQEGSRYPRASADSAGIPPVIGDTILSLPFNDLDIFASTLRAYKEDLAAVIVEPLFRGIPPKSGFLEEIRRLTKMHGVILIFDEVVTGFRLSWGGAQEYFGVVPDLATYGKAIGGGYPNAAIAGPRSIMKRLSGGAGTGGQQVISGGTFSGNPVSAAAGLATLDGLAREGVYQRLARAGSRLADGLRGLARPGAHGLVVLNTGPIVTVFFAAEHVVEDARAGNLAPGLRLEFAERLLDRGVMVNPHASWFVSAAHSDYDIDMTLSAAARSLAEMQESAH